MISPAPPPSDNKNKMICGFICRLRKFLYKFNHLVQPCDPCGGLETSRMIKQFLSSFRNYILKTNIRRCICMFSMNKFSFSYKPEELFEHNNFFMNKSRKKNVAIANWLDPENQGWANREFINCTNKNLLMHNQLSFEGLKKQCVH